MILKFKMPTHTDTCGWRIIDKVSRVDYEFVEKTSKLRKHAETACIMWINSYPIEERIPNSAKAIRHRVAEVHIVFEDDDKHEMLYTDDIVYIMNNDGKTCDTINI